MFQIIVFRYTGRIYRFEVYRKEQYASDKLRLTTNQSPIPVRDTLGLFLEHVKLHLNPSDRNQISGWVSKQHDGAISPDFVRSYVVFARFLKRVSYILESTIERMRLIDKTNEKKSTQREKCVCMLESMLAQALNNGGATRLGKVKWMAHVVVSDLEEFVDNPFGDVYTSSVPEGKYSREGLDMANRAVETHMTYGDCLEALVSYIHKNTPVEHLRILGYDKVDNVVVNNVNKRPFSAINGSISCVRLG
jgi:hypothetical protein